MNDIQTVTIYFKIVYGLVGATIVAYALYLARAERRARASLAARAPRNNPG
jgi:hypothetical protein